jgi:hypothetical protein|tara:strand:+ start:273 stop:452 length:180 start_codon:yes stop_codon:yes gene_type:complete
MNNNTECVRVLIEEYISTMTEQERLVLKIATEHLESSFSIERSIGYLEWLSNRANIKAD